MFAWAMRNRGRVQKRPEIPLKRKNAAVSAGAGVPIIKDYRVYDFKTEFRVGIFFQSV